MNGEERQLRIGAIYHHRKWKFENGEERPKFFVVLGEPDEDYDNFILALTTSNPDWKSYKPGCQPSVGVFFVETGELEKLKRDTWVQLAGLREFETRSVIQDSVNKDLEFVEFMPDNKVGELVNCVKIVDDVSRTHKNRVRNTYKEWLAVRKGGK